MPGVIDPGESGISPYTETLSIFLLETNLPIYFYIYICLFTELIKSTICVTWLKQQSVKQKLLSFYIQRKKATPYTGNPLEKRRTYICRNFVKKQ